MREQQLIQLLEAAIFAAEQPLSLQQLSELVAPHEVSKARVKAALQQLQQSYQERGVQLVEVASGYRFQTRAELAPRLAPLWQERAPRYSQALLETLALIAYRQPITRGDIEDIRGVSVSSQIMKTLQERNWIKVIGHREVPGRPQLYATTTEFLDYFNLTSLDQLPAIAARAELTPATAAAIPATESPEQEPSELEQTTAERATTERVH